jgi:hypothetical protein
MAFQAVGFFGSSIGFGAVYDEMLCNVQVMASNKRRTSEGRTEFQSWKKRKTSMYLK